MAGRELGGPSGATDKALEAWQTWNKTTFMIEGAVAAGAIAFGVPWLLALAATGAAVDGVQIYAIKEIQEKRKQKEVTMRPQTEYALAA